MSSFSKFFAIPHDAVTVGHRPSWRGERLKLIGGHPGGSVMADHLRQIAAGTLHDALVDQTHHRGLADISAIREN